MTVRLLRQLLGLVLGGALGLASTALWSTLAAQGSGPNLWLTSVSSGMTVSGTVGISAWADAPGLARLQFRIGGVNLGSEITSGACSANWNTTAVADGAYTVLALGHDDGGNPINAPPVTVTVQNTVAASPQHAQLTSPAANSTLTASAVTFQWTPGTATQDRIDVGTTAGNHEIFTQAPGTQLSASVSGLPTDGSTVYVRLWSLMGANWEYDDYTLIAQTVVAQQPAQLTSPAPGSTLTSSTVTFQWTGGTATQYWLTVGSASGVSDIYNQNLGAQLSTSVPGLPTNGSTLYVRLWSLLGANWAYNDYTLTATTVVQQRAQLTSPAPSSTLTSSTVIFRWTGGTATQYRLDIGTTAGNHEIFSQNLGTQLSAAVSGLPTNGSTVYVRLWSLMGANWAYNDYTLTAATVVQQRAQLTSPAPNSTLTATTVTFQWTGGTAKQYWLTLGSSPGTYQIYNQNMGTQLSATVASLPNDGSPVYVRLWSLMATSWEYNDYTVTAAGTTTVPHRAQLTSPAPNSTLTSSTVTFQWTGGTATQYWLTIGSSPGTYQIYNQNLGTQLNATVSGLPTNGSKIYVRLWSLMGAAWEYNDYILITTKTATQRAQLTSPAPSSTLTSSTVTFQWTGGTATQYWLEVGSTLGTHDIYNQNRGGQLSASVSGIPTDGRTLYVRLWSLLGSNWEYNDYTLTASTPGAQRAQLTSPAPGSTLTSTTVTFQWTGGTATEYWLDIRAGLGRRQIYSQNRGTQLSATVTGLPKDGSTVYVRLWCRINGAWQYNDYTLTALRVH